MRRFLLRLLATAGLLFPCGSWADAPKAVIDGPTDVPTGGSILLDARRSIGDRGLTWKLLPPHESDIFVTFDKGSVKDVVLFMPNPRPGVYRFILVSSSLVLDKAVPVDIALDVDVKEVTVAATPTPVPVPIPPGPGPGPGPAPVPPDPNPTPVVGKMRAIFLYETSTKFSKDQTNALNSTAIRSYMGSHTEQDPTGYGWRIWDKDADVSKVTPVWKGIWDVAKADTAPLPKIAISVNGGPAKVVPMPATEADTISLLKQYGGN